MMKFYLLLSLLSLTSAYEFSSTSIVITSADFPDNTPTTFTSLKSNSVYRIYATYETGATADYARKVIITDSTGASLTVAGLATPNPNSPYFLDNLRTLRAPITVQDTNNGGTKVQYTIYIVDASIASFPVVSARDVSQYVDSNNGWIGSGLTVLSADRLFTMSNFNMYGFSSMFISTVGFDQSSDQYNVMSLNSWEASRSFLTVYGPIATLFNTNWGDAKFKFTLSRNQFNQQLDFGAAFALMSPGYLSSGKSYNIPYTIPEASTATYTWNGNNFVGVGYSVRDVQNGETIHLELSSNDVPNGVDLKSNADNYVWQWANRVSMSVQKANGGHVPNFLFKVTSGASLSFSFATILLVSLFSKYY